MDFPRVASYTPEPSTDKDVPASPDSGVYMYVYVYVYVYVYGVGLSIIIILSNNKKRECSKRECSKRVVVTTQSREKEKGGEREKNLA